MPAAATKERATNSRQRSRHDAVINVRVPVRTRELIDIAAASLGKTRTEFVIESAKQHAIDVLLDQRLFSLSEDAFQAFADVLENPPAPSRRLKKLIKEKAPWEM